ncbi:hypothetical protein MMC18_008090 [Xylographa bjoerkii]|nr:hypothetical protein [Xylographa bjoerkii]
MLTPVRVRGKNKRDQSRKKQSAGEDSLSAFPVPKSRPGRPRKSKSAIAQSMVEGTAPGLIDASDASETTPTSFYHLSALEQLPTELLQTIFLISMNINLPMSSRHLGSALASPLLRTELVIHAFTRCRDSEDRLYAELRSSLLRQKWLTYNFLQRCQKTYLLRHAILVIQENSKEVARGIYRSNVVRITEAFDTYYSLSRRILMKLDSIYHSSGLDLSRDVVFEGTDQEGTAYSIVLDDEGSRMDVCRPFGAHPQDSIRPEDCFDVRKDFHTRTTYYLVSSDTPLTRCEIPEKLLHGPWTNERGYFLKLLMDADAHVNWLGSTNGEIVLQGFEDAIREDNSYAISVLRASGIENLESDTRIDTVRECLEDLEIGKTTVEDLTNPHGPWRLPAGNALLNTSSARVVPSTEHLKIAVLEKAAKFRVLKALLEGNGKTDIDCDDTEVVGWALQKRAEARATAASHPDLQGVSIGDWLLDTLEVVREKQKE